MVGANMQCCACNVEVLLHPDDGEHCGENMQNNDEVEIVLQREGKKYYAVELVNNPQNDDDDDDDDAASQSAQTLWEEEGATDRSSQEETSQEDDASSLPNPNIKDVSQEKQTSLWDGVLEQNDRFLEDEESQQDDVCYLHNQNKDASQQGVNALREEGFLEEQLVDDASSLHTENNDASHGAKTLLEEDESQDDIWYLHDKSNYAPQQVAKPMWEGFEDENERLEEDSRGDASSLHNPNNDTCRGAQELWESAEESDRLEEESQDGASSLHNQNIDLSQGPQTLWEEGEENDRLEEESQDDFSSLHHQNNDSSQAPQNLGQEEEEENVRSEKESQDDASTTQSASSLHSCWRSPLQNNKKDASRVAQTLWEEGLENDRLEEDFQGGDASSVQSVSSLHSCWRHNHHYRKIFQPVDSNAIPKRRNKMSKTTQQETMDHSFQSTLLDDERCNVDINCFAPPTINSFAPPTPIGLTTKERAPSKLSSVDEAGVNFQTSPLDDERWNLDISKLAQATASTIKNSTGHNGSKPYDGVVTSRHFAKKVLECKGVGRQDQHDHQFLDIEHAEFLRLFLDDYPKYQYWPLLGCLRSNKVVKKIVVFRKRQVDGERIRTVEELDCFFYALRDLPTTLRELHLWNLEEDTVLARGLQNHSGLEYVQLHMESGTVTPALAEALASMPNLIALELEVQASFRADLILESKSLLVLGIISNNFEFRTHHMVALIKTLETNKVLTVLDIEPKIPTYTVRVLMYALRLNKSLETVQFSCSSTCEEEGDCTLEEILNTLSRNTSLRVVWNHCYESLVVSEAMKQKTLSMLRNSPTIEQFHVFAEDPNFCYKKNALLEGNGA